MLKITYDNLGYLTTHELWEMMSELKIPYCTVEDVEKENLETKEKILIPKFCPRTDYSTMKDEIMIVYSEMGRSERRDFCRRWGKKIEKRMNEGVSNG